MTTNLLPGFDMRLHENIPVLRLHYSADPAKRPGTLEGDRWLRDASRGYPQGILGARWRKEMEIEYNALGGQAVFPDWEGWQQWIVVPPVSPEGLKLYGSYDHGWRNPACFLVHGVGTDGEILTLWEFYARQVPVKQIARIIQGHDVSWNGVRYPGNPFADLLGWIRADPSIWQEDQDMSDNAAKSIGEAFRRHGIVMTPAQKGGDTTVVEWLLGHYWENPQHPRYRITSQCPHLIKELGGLRHKELSARVALKQDQPESFLAKDDHAFDALKYFLQAFPPGPSARKPGQTPNTFMWWRKVSKAAQKGTPMPTFRREMV